MIEVFDLFKIILRSYGAKHFIDLINLIKCYYYTKIVDVTMNIIDIIILCENKIIQFP